MRSVRHTAIVIRAADYREYDKLVRLFTVDGGVISATLKGVKKPGAKLKFAAQPFAFCDFILNESNGFYTVTGASQIESLFALTGDPGIFAAGSVMLEAADAAVSSTPSPAVFVYLLKTLKSLLYQNKDPIAAAALFLHKVLENAGYGETIPGFRDAAPENLSEAGQGKDFTPAILKSAAEFEKRFGVTLASVKLAVALA